MLIAKARTGLPLNSHSLKMGTIKMCKWKKFECPNIGNIDQHNIKGQLKWITIFLYVEENSKIKLTQKTDSKSKPN